MELNDEQKQFIRDNFKENPNLIELTRKVFDNEDLDGRCREGRAVREFLTEENLEYKTTAKEKLPDILLSEQQEEFIKSQAENGLSAFQIAEILFPDSNVRRLSKEHLTILEFLREYEPSFVHESETAVNRAYAAPRQFSTCVKKVNTYTMQELEDGKLTRDEEDCINALLKSLSAPRLVQVISNYTSMKDRELFEAEFIRAVWDKPDLTSDEINLYINVCVDYINLKNISSHMEKLNRMFDEADEQQELTVRLSELLKTKSEEYNQCEKRQESLIQRLAGDRAKRISQRQDQNASILSLVESFQNEEERKLMVKMADMQKKAIKEEAEHLESMNEWKSRILGISKGDVI
jgi:hypothetical protein